MHAQLCLFSHQSVEGGQSDDIFRGVPQVCPVHHGTPEKTRPHVDSVTLTLIEGSLENSIKRPGLVMSGLGSGASMKAGKTFTHTKPIMAFTTS